MGTTAMGLPSTPGTIVTSPLNGPSPFSATTQPGSLDTTLAPVPLASDPPIPGTVVTCSTPTGQITPGTPAVPVTSPAVSGWHSRNTAIGVFDNANSPGQLFHAGNWKYGDDGVAARATRDIISRRSRTAAAAHATGSAATFHQGNTCTDIIDGERDVPSHAGTTTAAMSFDVIDSDDVIDAIRDHSLANRPHHDRQPLPPTTPLGSPSITVCSSLPGGPPTNGAALPLSTPEIPATHHPVRFSKPSRSLAAPASIRQWRLCQRRTRRHAPRVRR